MAQIIQPPDSMGLLSTMMQLDAKRQTLDMDRQFKTMELGHGVLADLAQNSTLAPEAKVAMAEARLNAIDPKNQAFQTIIKGMRSNPASFFKTVTEADRERSGELGELASGAAAQFMPGGQSAGEARFPTGGIRPEAHATAVQNLLEMNQAGQGKSRFSSEEAAKAITSQMGPVDTAFMKATGDAFVDLAKTGNMGLAGLFMKETLGVQMSPYAALQQVKSAMEDLDKMPPEQRARMLPIMSNMLQTSDPEGFASGKVQEAVRVMAEPAPLQKRLEDITNERGKALDDVLNGATPEIRAGAQARANSLTMALMAEKSPKEAVEAYAKSQEVATSQGQLKVAQKAAETEAERVRIFDKRTDGEIAHIKKQAELLGEQITTVQQTRDPASITGMEHTIKSLQVDRAQITTDLNSLVTLLKGVESERTKLLSVLGLSPADRKIREGQLDRQEASLNMQMKAALKKANVMDEALLGVQVQRLKKSPDAAAVLQGEREALKKAREAGIEKPPTIDEVAQSAMTEAGGDKAKALQMVATKPGFTPKEKADVSEWIRQQPDRVAPAAGAGNTVQNIMDRVLQVAPPAPPAPAEKLVPLTAQTPFSPTMFQGGR